MAEQKSRQFELKKITITTNSDKEMDIRKMVPDFKSTTSLLRHLSVVWNCQWLTLLTLT